MKITLDTKKIKDYRKFIAVKRLPSWSIKGSVATFPDIYADRLGLKAHKIKNDYEPESFLFDYQKDITRMAIERQKFAVFADCGLGKTHILLSYAKYAQEKIGKKKRVLICTPPLVIKQMLKESKKYWGDDIQLERVAAANLSEWISGKGSCIGVTNYEALKETTPQGRLGALILDESSILKSFHGNYANTCLRLGKGLDWKLCLTGTPAPNDRVEYANHAVFLDRFPTVNSFLATYFVNKAQTAERWILKPHAVNVFYKALSDWSIFLTDPSVYGWKDNCGTIPPIIVHMHDVPMTAQQRDWVRKTLGVLVATKAGGITKRSSYGQVSKGHYQGVDYGTLKYDYMQNLVSGWHDKESTLVWCIYDKEQARCHEALGGDSISGPTPMAKREQMVEDFCERKTKVLISKPRILGFGLNLQVATRQVFSGLQDSYEQYYQAVKRSNRIGSTKPLNVHIPLTELEYPMVSNVLKKADRVESDSKKQEQLFRKNMG